MTFFETDINRDGGKIMLTAGAPRSLGHEEERMLRATRLVDRPDRRAAAADRRQPRSGLLRRLRPVLPQDVLGQGRRDQPGGPGHGQGRTGPAARDPRRCSSARSTVFETEPLAPFMVKGKSQPVEAASVGLLAGGPRGGGDARPARRSRRGARACSTRALDAARAGSGVRRRPRRESPGSASRASSTSCAATRPTSVVLLAACEEYESSTPYFPFRALLRDVLGLPVDAVASSRCVERLRHRVEVNGPGAAPVAAARRGAAGRRDPGHPGDRPAGPALPQGRGPRR